MRSFFCVLSFVAPARDLILTKNFTHTFYLTGIVPVEFVFCSP